MGRNCRRRYRNGFSSAPPTSLPPPLPTHAISTPHLNDEPLVLEYHIIRERDMTERRAHPLIEAAAG